MQTRSAYSRIFAANAASSSRQILADQRQRDAQPVGLDGVFHVHRRGAEVQLAASVRRLTREDANLGHQIVVDLAFDRKRRVDVDLAGVRAQIGDLGLVDEPLRALRFG